MKKLIAITILAAISSNANAAKTAHQYAECMGYYTLLYSTTQNQKFLNKATANAHLCMALQSKEFCFEKAKNSASSFQQNLNTMVKTMGKNQAAITMTTIYETGCN